MLVATAGHVDHGKTSLVKHLTGTDTDRLAEEKQRGLTIELGYAFIGSETGPTIGFIDVPGHHRFINTMISGINGIDLGMLVVAADDGPMPQTLEHLQLLRLLGVERFLGVITKSDLVDSARLEQVAAQTAELIPEAPICPISNRTGDGLDQLRSILEEQIRTCPPQQTESQFRLYADRVFIKKGAGVVVTGTCLSGIVRAGDELRLHPSASNPSQVINVRVREIYVQGQRATAGHAGQRCALNLSGKVSMDRVHRGDFLCAHATAMPSRRLDARCRVVEGQTLKHLGRVKLYLGTRRIGARTYLLDRGDGGPSDFRLQLILDREILAFAGDRFVLREDSERATLAGGVVVDPDAPRWGKSRRNRLRLLDALELGAPERVLDRLLFDQGDPVSLRWCQRIWNLSRVELDELLERLSTDPIVRIRVEGDELVLSRERWETCVRHLDQQLSLWHSGHPTQPGISPESLQALLHHEVPDRLFKPLLEDRIAAGQIVQQDQLVSNSGHRPIQSEQVEREWRQLEALIKTSGFRLPLRSELQRDTGFDATHLESLARPAIKSGSLLEIGEKRLALPATLLELATLVKQFIDESGDLSVIQAKQVFGLGRNLTIEILEFFDQIGLTKRRGNARIVADPEAAQRKLRNQGLTVSFRIDI